MNEWQPISTVPTNRPVELGRFPCVDHKPNITIGSNIKLAFPDATHWRELTPDAAAAACRTR